IGPPLLVARKYQTGGSDPRKTSYFLRHSCHKPSLQCRNAAPRPHGRLGEKFTTFHALGKILARKWNFSALSTFLIVRAP
ncbi:MAG: hypothetical protein NTX21_08190, partial [Alphaproteobacteria bacterium]|nr:hypothetical protein [Alphaproteobacteria bacterium]